MAGLDTEFRGEAQLAPGATVGLLEQEPQLDESKDVRGNVEDGVAETRALLDRFNELAANYSDETADEFAAAAGAHRRRRRLEPRHATSSTRWTRCACRRPTPTSPSSPAASAAASRCAGCCSARPTCCCSTSRPTTSTPSRSAWLERHLAEYKGTVVAVTHDRYFLDNVAGWILELDRGRGIPYEGNYSSWLEQKQKRLAQEEKTEKARQRTIAAELDWVRQNPKGRQTKQKARLQNFEALVAQERNVKLDEVQIHIPTSTHLGNVVVEAEHLRKGFGDNLLIEDLSFSLPPGGIVGIIGANGAGKTTLFRMITGQEQPDAGTLRIGDTGHGSFRNDDNAVTELAAAVARVGTYEWPHKITDAQRAFLEAVSEAFEIELDPDRAEETLARLGSIARMVGATMSNTANPTMLPAGYKHNVIPGRATAAIDGRFVPGGEEEFYATITELLGDEVRYEVREPQPAVETEFSGALVEAMQACLVAEDPGARAVPYLMSGGTDAKAWDRLGIRCFGFAPLRLPPDLDFVGMFHGVDERVPTESLEFGARVLDRFLDQA